VERRIKRGEGFAILGVLVVMLAVLFWPTPVDKSFDKYLYLTLGWLQDRGAPGWLGYDLVEFVANVIFFAPLGALAASLVMRPLWWASGVAGLTFSLIAEFAQATALPGRYASPADLLANTLGSVLGGIAHRLLSTRTKRVDHPDERA
jgi:glycopeptide antibiotics resistance protein